LGPTGNVSGVLSFRSKGNKLERKVEHCAFIEIFFKIYSYRFAIERSNKLFEGSSICLDIFSVSRDQRTCKLTKHCGVVDASYSVEDFLEKFFSLSKAENIVKWIKGQRISWLGHLERMEEDRMHKKIFTQELKGTRRRIRPRKRWKEEVE